MRTTPRTPTLRTALAAAVALLALAACSGSDASVRDASGAVVKAGTWSVFDLRKGDCLSPDPDAKGEVAKIDLVPCAQAHGQEVYASVTHPADAFPGVATISQWADARCVSELQTTLHVSPDDGYFISYLLPSFDSWNKRKDRTVTCVLVFPNEPARVGGVVAQLLAGQAAATAAAGTAAAGTAATGADSATTTTVAAPTTTAGS